MEGGSRMERQKKKIDLRFLGQLLFIVVLVIILRTFVFGTIAVKGSSMEPTFHHGDIVAMNKLAYRLGAPEKGDIVICWVDSGNTQENIIKRVIGLPGDELELREVENQSTLEYDLYINGEKQEEPYLEEIIQQPGDQEYPYTVPEGSYFVMGDNRNVSTDSRTQSIGAIEKKNVLGKVVGKIYPFSFFGK